jgi:hypothetical protein
MRRLCWMLVCGCLAARAPELPGSRAGMIVRVQPEAVLTLRGPEQATVKIRLPRGGQAFVWTSDSCAAGPGEAAYRITVSGTHLVPLQGAGRVACLSAPSGTLRAVRSPVPQIPPRE